MISLTQQFLDVHWDRKKPLLLGYSGGADSKALLYALLECGAVPHIAHVDHGWREESQKEAREIEEEARGLGCPFLTTRLALNDRTEDGARKGRYTFFSSLFPGYEALLLAHQAEDLAETVLKRLFEGAHLAHLGGMEPISCQQGMTVWRPFLFVKRREILQFLEERGLTPLMDPTNEDPTYLRARMRRDLFPFLNERFGKEVAENLTLLSKRSHELKYYLNQNFSKVPIQRGPWGVLIDLSPFHPLEQTHFLQTIGREFGLILQRGHLQTLLNWIQKGEKSKQIRIKTKKILVDKGRVWFFSSLSKDLESSC